MTDSNQTPSPNHAPIPTSSSTQTEYEGTDPDLRERDDKGGSKTGVSPVQVGASAAAAVTSALAASFFGVAGTLIGAAVGSIISTIAGAMYTHYLGRAHERLRNTTEVVIQRIPGEVLTATPLRHLAPNAAAPNAVPGQDSMRPIGQESGDESVSVPVSEAGDLLKAPDGKAVLGAGSAGPDGAGAASERPWWKRPVVALSAVSMAGFLIALGVVLVSEQAIGHPLSGGTSGNSISKITGGGDDDPDRDTPKTEVTPTATSTADQDDDAPAPTETAQESVTPTASSGTDTEATGEPDAPATDDPAAPSTGEADQDVAPLSTEAS